MMKKGVNIIQRVASIINYLHSGYVSSTFVAGIVEDGEHISIRNFLVCRVHVCCRQLRFGIIWGKYSL